MATIKGDRTEIKPGFCMIMRNVPEGKAVAFYNETTDTQFSVCYQFQDAKIVDKSADTKYDDETGRYAIDVYPGDTKEFVTGTWKGFRRSMSFGAPDAAWQEQRDKQSNGKIEEEIAAVKALLKANPKADGKYTVEYIADLCVANNVPFVDLTFPPVKKSFARDWERQLSPAFAWTRPKDYTEEEPLLFVGDIEPNDIDQGELGNCYFLCSLACIAEFPPLVRAAFSPPQNPEVGVYRILICKNGLWQTVIVDDYIPTKGGKPCFAKNREEPNELWVSLLEKAYAKLHGSYAAIIGGNTGHAIADLLGTSYERFQGMKEWTDKPAMFQVLKESDENEYLMTVSAPGDQALEKEYTAHGLALNHAYSLIAVKEVEGNQLLMIRNPWGNGQEWNGKWSDDSSLWTPSMKAAVDFVAADDGIFWMCWEDVCKYFEGGCLAYIHKPRWPQIRIPGNFEQGVPDFAVFLKVTKPVRMMVACHQKDVRGLPKGDKDAKLVATLVGVLSESPSGTGCTIAAQSGAGVYSGNRDTMCMFELEPQEKPYMVYCQGFDQTVTKSFVCSLLVSDATAFSSISFKSAQPSIATTRYNPLSRCTPSKWDNATQANYQIRLACPEKGVMLFSKTSDSIDLRILRDEDPPGAASPSSGGASPTSNKPAAQVAAAPSAAAPGKKAAHVDPMAAGAGAAKPAAATAPAAKAPAPKPAPKKAAEESPQGTHDDDATEDQLPVSIGKVKLQMIVIQGRNLVSKDSNGLSDPYITTKLKTKGGLRLANHQRSETRYINNTLNPVWCETFVFNCTPADGDVLLLRCYDKDMFGRDEMGELSISVKDALNGLKKGGASSIGWYPLAPPPSDASGEIQLGFSWLL